MPTVIDKPRLDRRIAKLLSGSPRTPGRCYKLAEAGVGRDTIAAPSIDPGQMSVTATINTPAIDRDDEIIMPSGVDVTNYTLNPTVLWEHGWGGIDTPIAKCEDDQGNLGLAISEAEIVATSYFTDRDPLSWQIFNLIDTGLIRATSIHVIPRPNTAQFKNLEDGRRIVIFPDTEMVEYSWGRIGVNPEAVRKLCSDRKVGSETLHDSLLKSLLPFAAPKPAQAAGINLPRLKAMDPEKKPEEEVKTPDTEEKPVENPDEVQPEEETAKGKPSERFLSGISEAMASLAAMVEAGESEIENPEALTYAASLKDQLATMCSECEAASASLSGTAKPKKAKKTLAPDDAEAIRAYVSRGGSNPMLVKGYAEQVATVAKSKGLTDLERTALEGVAANLRRIKTMHKPAPKVEPKIDTSDVRKTFSETRETIAALNARFNLTP